MKTGDTIELIEDISFYKMGKKAHFIRVSNRNSNNIEILKSVFIFILPIFSFIIFSNSSTRIFIIF